ncbi:MAG TPA: GNAT family N-acetyltransferase [Kineosporiaceae bacterium]|nr:GNAT family N-acetyltransferase [Kineosporiaceae bacterium]
MRRRQPEYQLTGGLRLRAWTLADTAGLLLAMRDPLVVRYAGFLVKDRAEAELHIQRYAAGWAAGEGPAWAISDGPGALLGSVRFGLTDRALGCGMVGYWLLPPARGHGVVSAAVRIGSELVLGSLGWHRVELRHAVENERSCAVARRCGYRLEGTMRGAMRYPSDGRWSDEHLHARLAGDPRSGS